MLRPVIAKRVACYPVTCDPIEAVSVYPSMDFDMRASVIDKVSGVPMDTTLPATNLKHVVKNGELVSIGADQPGFIGDSCRICSQFTNLWGGGNLAEAINTSRYTIEDYSTIDGWPVKVATAINNPMQNYYRLEISALHGDTAVTSGKQYKYRAWVYDSDTDIVAWFAYGEAGAINGRVRVKLSDLSIVEGTGARTGFTVDEVTVERVGQMYEVCVVVTYSVSTTDETAGFGPYSTTTGDKFYYAHFQKTEGCCPVPILNVSGETQQTVTRASEGGAADNGFHFTIADNPIFDGSLSNAGALHPKIRMSFDKSAVSSVVNIISIDDTGESILYLDASGNLCATDGTNTCTSAVSYSAGDWLDCVVDWSNATGKLNLSVNSTAATEQTFSGFSPATDMVLLWGVPSDFGCIDFDRIKATDVSEAA